MDESGLKGEGISGSLACHIPSSLLGQTGAFLRVSGIQNKPCSLAAPVQIRIGMQGQLVMEKNLKLSTLEIARALHNHTTNGNFISYSIQIFLPIPTLAEQDQCRPYLVQWCKVWMQPPCSAHPSTNPTDIRKNTNVLYCIASQASTIPYLIPFFTYTNPTKCS